MMHRRNTRWRSCIGIGILGGIFLGIVIDIHSQPIVVINEASAHEQVSIYPREVLIKVHTDWTPERIEQEIRDTFPETPNTAVAIAKAEGGLVTERQSHLSYPNGEQERSFCAFQIHEPDWDRVAKKIGYGDYKTDPAHCIAMARYIYDNHGWQPWSAYKNGSYKKHLK